MTNTLNIHKSHLSHIAHNQVGYDANSTRIMCEMSNYFI